MVPHNQENDVNYQQMAHARQKVGQSWGNIQPERWEAVKKLPAHYKVLDVGCSTGNYVRQLQSANYQVWGTDILREPDWYVQPQWFLQSDASRLPFADKSIDAILLFEVLEHLPQPIHYLREFRRICRHTILLSVPNCQVPAELRQAGLTFHHWIDPTHVNFFTKETLAQTIREADLTIKQIDTINPIRPEALLLASWGWHGRWADRFIRALEKLPWRQKYGMTLLATIST